jgi:hypothetical protein
MSETIYGERKPSYGVVEKSDGRIHYRTLSGAKVKAPGRDNSFLRK